MPNKNDDNADFDPFEDDDLDGTLDPGSHPMDDDLGSSFSDFISSDENDGEPPQRGSVSGDSSFDETVVGESDLGDDEIEGFLSNEEDADEAVADSETPISNALVGESSFDETVLGESDLGDDDVEGFLSNEGDADESAADSETPISNALIGESSFDETVLGESDLGDDDIGGFLSDEEGGEEANKESGTLNPNAFVSESSFDETVLEESDINAGTAAYSESMEDEALSNGGPVQDEIETDDSFKKSNGDTLDPDRSVVEDTDEVVGDSSIHENTVAYSESMGGLGDEMDEFEEFAAVSMAGNDPDAGESGGSSQIWRTSSHGGSSDAPVRKISGDAPFGQSAEADYQVVEKLAEGGMGAVYVAKQTSLNRTLAIKTLKPLKAEDKKSLEKSGRLTLRTRQLREGFLAEAQVTANLVHPNIVPIHDLCQNRRWNPFLFHEAGERSRMEQSEA